MRRWKSAMGILCASALVVGSVPPPTVLAASTAGDSDFTVEEDFSGGTEGFSGTELGGEDADSMLDSQFTQTDPQITEQGDVQTQENGGELLIRDVCDLDDLLAEQLGDNNVIKVATSFTVAAGNTVLPAQIKTIVGWQEKNFFDEEGEVPRTLGNKNISGETFTFEQGSDTTVRKINFAFRDDKSLVIPEGVTVTFESCSFNNTIVNHGTAIFQDCTFENGKIENHGDAQYTGDTEEPENVAKPETPVGGELVIRDVCDLDDLLAEQLGDNDVIKVATSFTVATGNTVLPAQIKTIVGWQEKNFFDEEGEVPRTLGNKNISGETFTFEQGSDTTVRKINFAFRDDKSLIIPEGAYVTFEDCDFSTTIVNNGSAVFNNCTFQSGEIENNGTAEYINGTVEPENIGTPSGGQHINLGLTVEESKLSDAVQGTPYEKEIGYELSGSNKDDATISVSVDPTDSGISAVVENDKIVLSGTPSKTGTVTVTVTAEATGDETVSKDITLTVNEKLSVSLEGELDCVTAGQIRYQNYLNVYVADEKGNKVDYYDYSQQNPDSKIQVSLSPEGSGLQAYWLYDTVVVAGDAEKAGTYTVTVTVTDKGQTLTSNSKELRIYTGKETLKEQFAQVEGAQESWDMEPYEISSSDHAVVPTQLKTIYGSHESGLYGIIGNNQSVGTDTLTIPSGCQVTFENVKFYSSVKLIVERGASLTLRDSVAFGEIEVNGGRFSIGNSSALTDRLILNDGSTLADSELVSNYTFLTDGAEKREIPAVVIVNGKVTAEGTSTITGDESASDKAGQTGLQVNGELVISEGSTLTVNGGGDGSYVMGAGGVAVELNGGKISGAGKLIANGGHGVDAVGGTAIDGYGTVYVAELEATGGDSEKLIIAQKKGGDAVGELVTVSTENPTLKGGKGNPDGISGVLETPELISGKNDSYNKVSVKWKTVENAEGYQVYRKTGDGYWKKLAQISGGAVTSYVDSSVVSGTTYRYTVRALRQKDGKQVLSGYDHTGLTVKVQNAAPQTPKLVKASSYSYNKIKVTWKSVKDVDGYFVFRKLGSGYWKKISQIKGEETTSYIDMKASTDTVYRYTVRAYKTVKGENRLSGYDKTGVSAKAVPNKSAITALSSKGKGSMTVQWKKISGADGYRVYRINSKGNYTYVAQVASGSTLQYTEKGLKSGQTYNYKVRAYRTVGGEKIFGAYSDIRSASVR